MRVAFVRRIECVAYFSGSRPMPLTHSETRRAYCRVVRCASADPDSFDSRYIGPIDRAHVMGFALPVWRPQPRRLARLPLLELFERGVQLRQCPHHLSAQSGQVADRIVLAAQEIQVETPGDERFKRLIA